MGVARRREGVGVGGGLVVGAGGGGGVDRWLLVEGFVV